MRKAITVFAALLVSLSLMGQGGEFATAGSKAVGQGGVISMPGGKKTGTVEKNLRFGVDASSDFFISASGSVPVSFGLGIRARYGRPDQWINLIGGLRYIYGSRLSGFQVPLLLNVNLLRTSALSAYIGSGYEFDFISTYWGAVRLQTGVLPGPRTDIQFFYKPYQGDIGLGFTYYF